MTFKQLSPSRSRFTVNRLNRCWQSSTNLQADAIQVARRVLSGKMFSMRLEDGSYGTPRLGFRVQGLGFRV